MNISKQALIIHCIKSRYVCDDFTLYMYDDNHNGIIKNSYQFIGNSCYALKGSTYLGQK